jgi:hypothetical protein
VSAGYNSAKDPKTPGGATIAEVEKRGGGTSDADLKAYASAGGGVAAAAVCTAYGASAAAPLCAWVGGKVGGAIYSGVSYLVSAIFGASDAEKEIARRQRSLQASNALAEIDFMDQKNQEALLAVENAIIVLHSQLFPDALPVTSQQTRQMLKGAGLNLVMDYMGLSLPADGTRPQRYRDTCRSGYAVPDGLVAPHLAAAILTQSDQFLTAVGHKCNGQLYNDVRTSISEDEAFARNATCQQAVSAWLLQLQSAAKTVTGSLINLSSNVATQELLAQAKSLRDSNAALAANNALLTAELTFQKEWESKYSIQKRAVAMKRVEAEKKKSEEFTKALTATQDTERKLMIVAGVILLASVGTAVVLSRRKS